MKFSFGSDKKWKKFKLNKVQNAFSLWRNIPRKAITKRKVIPAGEIVVKTTVANTLWSSHLIKLKRKARLYGLQSRMYYVVMFINIFKY